MSEKLKKYLDAQKEYDEELSKYFSTGWENGKLKFPEKTLSAEGLNHLTKMKENVEFLHKDWWDSVLRGEE